MSAKMDVTALARQAGLDRALQLFPKDVNDAVASAAAGALAVAGDLPPAIAPYPPARPAVAR